MNTERNSLLKSIKPVLVLLKTFGIYPIKVYESAETRKNGFLEILWSFSIMLFFNTYSIYSSYTLNWKGARESEDFQFRKVLEITGDTVQIILSLFNTIVITLTTILLRKPVIIVPLKKQLNSSFLQLSQIITNLEKFDKKMYFLDPSFDVNNEYKLTFKYATRAIVLLGIIYFIYLILDIKLFVIAEPNFITIGSECISYLYPSAIVTLLILQFSIMLFVLKRRFAWINITLRKGEQHYLKQSNQKTNKFRPLIENTS